MLVVEGILKRKMDLEALGGTFCSPWADGEHISTYNGIQTSSRRFCYLAVGAYDKQA